MSQKIIAFGHQRRKGKDTCGQMAYDYVTGLSVAKVSIIRTGKEIAHSLFGWGGLEAPDFYDKQENQHLKDRSITMIYGKTPRQIWIAIGNDMTAIHPHVWIESLIAKMKGIDVVIITDLWRKLEADVIHRMGGICVKVRNNRVKDFPEDDNGLLGFDWDASIDNHWTLENLRDQVNDLTDGVLYG